MIRNQQGSLNQNVLAELQTVQRRNSEQLRLERIRAGAQDIDRPAHQRNQGDFFHMLGGFVNDIVCCQPDLKGWGERERVEQRRNSKTQFQVKHNGDLPADKKELDALAANHWANGVPRSSTEDTVFSTADDFFQNEISKHTTDQIEVVDGVN
jgi:hypothetical protein